MCFDRNIHQFIQYATRTKKKYKNLSEKTPLFSNGIIYINFLFNFVNYIINFYL